MNRVRDKTVPLSFTLAKLITTLQYANKLQSYSLRWFVTSSCHCVKGFVTSASAQIFSIFLHK